AGRRPAGGRPGARDPSRTRRLRVHGATADAARRTTHGELPDPPGDAYWHPGAVPAATVSSRGDDVQSSRLAAIQPIAMPPVSEGRAVPGARHVLFLTIAAMLSVSNPSGAQPRVGSADD